MPSCLLSVLPEADVHEESVGQIFPEFLRDLFCGAEECPRIAFVSACEIPPSVNVLSYPVSFTVELLYVGLLHVGHSSMGQFTLERRDLLLYVLCVRPTPICGTLLYCSHTNNEY